MSTAVKKRSAEEACRDTELLCGDAKRAMADLGETDTGAAPCQQPHEPHCHGMAVPAARNMMALPADALNIIISYLQFRDAQSLGLACTKLLGMVRKRKRGTALVSTIEISVQTIPLISRYCLIREKPCSRQDIPPVRASVVRIRLNLDILTGNTAVASSLIRQLVAVLPCQCPISIESADYYSKPIMLPHANLLCSKNLVVTSLTPRVFSLPSQKIIVYACQYPPTNPSYTDMCLFNGPAFTLCCPSAESLVVIGPMPLNGLLPSQCLVDVITTANLQQLVVTNDDPNISNLIDIVPVLRTLRSLCIVNFGNRYSPAPTDQIVRLLTLLSTGDRCPAVILPIPSRHVMNYHRMTHSESYVSTLLRAFPTAAFCITAYQLTRIRMSMMGDNDDPDLHEIMIADKKLRYMSTTVTCVIVPFGDHTNQDLLINAAAHLAK